jgi:hypothetical protein
MALADGINSISDARLQEIVRSIFRESAVFYRNSYLIDGIFLTLSTTLGSLNNIGALWGMVGVEAIRVGISMYGYWTIEDPGGLIDNVRQFATYVNNTYYQNYFQLIGPYYSVNEICDICMVPNAPSNGERMVLYYERAGIPSIVAQARTDYENGSISEASLMSTMHLDTWGQVGTVFGSGWGVTAKLNRTLLNAGASANMATTSDLISDVTDYLSTIDSDAFDDYLELSEAIAESTLSLNQIDPLLMEVLYGITDLTTHNKITATSGQPNLTGTGNADLLFGNALDNTISGGTGDDILVGVEGSDILNGGAGSDIYIWRLGDGNDVISDASSSGENNVLIFGEGVLVEDISFSQNGNDLVFTNDVSGETITLKDWFSDDSYKLAEVKFYDGAIWTGEQISDSVLGSAGQTISGTSGVNVRTRGSGNNTISGLGGADTITGGKGNDRLEGGAGNDTYAWNLGDGNDTVYDNSGTNRLEIGDGVDASELSLNRSGNNLIIQMNDEPRSTITLEKWYSGSAYQLAGISFADGTAWTKADINDIASGAKAPFASSYMESLSMEIAIAGLRFGSSQTEQVGDISGYTPFVSNQLDVSTTVESLASGYFNKLEKEN